MTACLFRREALPETVPLCAALMLHSIAPEPLFFWPDGVPVLQKYISVTPCENADITDAADFVQKYFFFSLAHSNHTGKTVGLRKLYITLRGRRDSL